MKTSDLYLKRTDINNKGKVIITHHRVWDSLAFLNSQIDAGVKDNILISVATLEEYRKFKLYGRGK